MNSHQRKAPGAVVSGSRVRGLAVGELDRVCGVAPGPSHGAGVGDVPASSVSAPTGGEAGTMIAAGRLRPGVVVVGGRPWTVGSVEPDAGGLVRLTSSDGRRCLRLAPSAPVRVVVP